MFFSQLYLHAVFFLVVESQPEFSFLHPPDTSPCREPAPVPSAHRRFNQYGDVSYTCYDQYLLYSGDRLRSCHSGQYNGTPPTCLLQCGSPAQYVDQTYNVTTENEEVVYSCRDGYDSSGDSHAYCKVYYAHWSISPLFCSKKLDLSAPDGLFQRAVDNNNATCVKLNASHPKQWTINVGLGNSTKVDIYSIRTEIQEVKPAALRMSPDAILNITVSTKSFKRLIQLNKNTNNFTYNEGSFLPFGNDVFFSTNARNITVCEVIIYGRPYSGNCPSPPAFPSLKLVTNVTHFGGVFKFSASVQYHCADHLYYIGGNTLSTCSDSNEWTTPQLACSDDTNFASTMGAIARNGNPNDEEHLHDNNSSTCMPLSPNSSTQTFEVTLASDVEIHYITVTTAGGPVACSANVTTPKNETKICVSGISSSSYLTCVVSCPLYRRGYSVHLQVTANDTVINAGGMQICEIRVLGVNNTDKVLECIRTPSGHDYRGRLNSTQDGRWCVAWTKVQLPPDPSTLPDASLVDAQNFCRNPVLSTQSKPWCYVNAGTTETDFCPVINCDDFFSVGSDSAGYRGDISDTESKERCVDWFSEPALWNFYSFPSPGSHSPGSKCRNPGASQSKAWCYVDTNGTSRYCHIPQPPETLQVYEEPDVERMALSRCLQLDSVLQEQLSSVAAKARFPCSSDNTRSPTRLCITDNGIIAVRIWCAENFCQEPPPVANAYRLYDNTGAINSVVNYTCYHGYRLTSGNLTRTCMSYGRYSGSAPVCTLDCRLLPQTDPPLDNGNESIANASIVSACFCGNFSAFTCNDTSGQWNLHESCEVNVTSCASPPAIPRLQVVNETIANSTYSPGDNVTYSCAKGFYLQGGLDTSTCHSDFQFYMESDLICRDDKNLANWTAGTISKQLTDNLDDTCVTFTRPYINLTLTLLKEVEVRLVAFTFTVLSVVSATVEIEGRSNKTKKCNLTDIAGDGTVLTVTCVSMPAGKAVHIYLHVPSSDNENTFILCEIRIFGREYYGALGCLQTTDGYDYKGYANANADGSACTPWADHYAAMNETLWDWFSLFPDTDGTDLSNFCRRPTQEFQSVGCFAADSASSASSAKSVSTAQCDVKLCSSVCTLDPPLARDYNGPVDKTMTGAQCVRWDSPGLPFMRKEDFPGGNMAHGYCRNPAASQSQPWCYINVTSLAFGHCAVPECKATCPEPAPVPNAYRSYYSHYVGTRISYSCYHGYNHTSGNLIRWCQNDGTYSGQAPVCAFLACYDGSSYRAVGDNITVSCSSAVGVTATCDPRERRLVTNLCPGVCFGAPIIPRLQIISAPDKTNVTRYACADGLYPVAGKTAITCLPNGSWENSTLQCEAWTNYALRAMSVRSNAADVWHLTDDNPDTCSQVNINPSTVVMVVLKEDLEVRTITIHFGDNRSNPELYPDTPMVSTVSVDVVSSRETKKPCSQTVMYDIMIVVTCTQAPVGRAIHVELTASSDSPVIHLCEVRIFGRPFHSGEFRLINQKMDFWAGIQRCRDMGGDLLSIHDNQTQAMAFSLCRWSASPCWIGLYQGLYNEWTDKSVIDYDPYVVNSPSEVRCTAIVASTPWSWPPRQCSENIFPICSVSNVTAQSSVPYISLPHSDALECLQWPEGKEYKGGINFTQKGYTCLRWDSLPAQWSLSVEDLPDETLEEAGNKCRNPLGFNTTRPWCFVNGTEAAWEYCNIPSCSEFCQIKSGLAQYSGSKNTSQDGGSCVKWALVQSAAGFRNPEDFPQEYDLNHNFCRNPADSQTKPWCYKDTSGKTYDHCYIPDCSSTLLFFEERDPQLPAVLGCLGPQGVFTDATAARPSFQKMCLTTEELSLTILCYTMSYYFAAVRIQCDLCPDPKMYATVTQRAGQYKAGSAWTYSCAAGRFQVSGSGTYTCGADTKWTAPTQPLLCKDWFNYAQEGTINGASSVVNDDNITSCTALAQGVYALQMSTQVEVSVITFTLESEQTTFIDQVKVTSGNRTCSDVTVYGSLVVVRCSQAPVTRTVTLEVVTSSTFAGRVCEWRVFGRPAATDGAAGFLECLESDRGTEYKGSITFTRNGVTCLRWDSVTASPPSQLPDQSLTEAANKCRNPGGSDTSPWCYVNSTGSVQAESCYIPKCSDWCDVINGTTDYKGNVRESLHGPCSMWSEVQQNETVKPFRPEDFPDNSLDHYFCRNPNNSLTGPWCYTDFTGTSQSCSVPQCPTSLLTINESNPTVEGVTSCFLSVGGEASFQNVRAESQVVCKKLSLTHVTVLCKVNSSQLAAVSIECDQCPPLPATSGVVLENKRYASGTNVSFTCSDSRVPVGGASTLLCSYSLQWEYKSHDFPCKNWVSYGNSMEAISSVSLVAPTVTPVPGYGVQPSVGNVSTCMDLSTGSYLLPLLQPVEVGYVTLYLAYPQLGFLPTPTVRLGVAVTGTQLAAKNCTLVSTSDPLVFRCPLGPVGTQVQLDVDLRQADALLCGWRAYGRPVISENSKAIQCLQSQNGVDYKGDVNFTRTGVACLRWDSLPSTRLSIDDFPDGSFAEAGNKCRNPGPTFKNLPWCYVPKTTDVDWDFCWIPPCASGCWLQNGLTSYQGNVSVASSNKTCVPWKDVLARETPPFLWSWDFPDMSVDHNFCRNPNNSAAGPWCYTDLNGTSQTCSVPHCPTDLGFCDEDACGMPPLLRCYLPDAETLAATLGDLGSAYHQTCLSTQQLFLTSLCATSSDLVAVRIQCLLPSSMSTPGMSSDDSTIFSNLASTALYLSSSLVVGETSGQSIHVLPSMTDEQSTTQSFWYTTTSSEMSFTTTPAGKSASPIEAFTSSYSNDIVTIATTASTKSGHTPGDASSDPSADAPTTSTTNSPTTATTTTNSPTTATTTTNTTSTAVTTPSTSNVPTAAITTDTPTTTATTISTTPSSDTAVTPTTTFTTASTTPSDQAPAPKRGVCPCSCASLVMQQSLRDAATVRQLAVQQQRELTVDKQALSSTRRKKECDRNHSVAAVATGSVLGVGAVAVVVAALMLHDLLTFSIFLRRVWRRAMRRWRRR